MFSDLSVVHVPQLHVGHHPTTRPKHLVAFGCNQFHTWHFHTGKAGHAPEFTNLVRGGTNQPLHIAVESCTPSSRCTEVKRFLDWYLCAHPGKLVFWDITGARDVTLDLSKYHNKEKKFLVRTSDGRCLMHSLVHALGCVAGREAAMGWLPHLLSTFNCSRPRDVRAYCDNHQLPIRVSKVRLKYPSVFNSNPLVLLLSGAVMGHVLLVETPGNPSHSFVVDGVN